LELWDFFRIFTLSLTNKTKLMHYKTIQKLQKKHNLSDLQEKINTGIVWKLEGSYGRAASNALESGACMLPKERFYDYYGNTVPSRDDLKKGTKGTFQNSVKFWKQVEDGTIDL
jgi:hypothetical protein